MRQFLIRYRTTPDQAGNNEKLVRAVFAELAQVQPDELGYATFKLADQVTFLHLVRAPQLPSPLVQVKAFGEFQAGIADRYEQPPVREELTMLGSYRMFG